MEAGLRPLEVVRSGAHDVSDEAEMQLDAVERSKMYQEMKVPQE